MTPADPVDYFLAMDAASLIAAFSFSVMLDIPRYTFGFLAVLVVELSGRGRPRRSWRPPSISVIIAGHNEAASIRRCVMSLREQTLADVQIICVDDGSTDGMASVLYRLRAEGLIDVALALRVRSSKSSACNLALSRARGDVRQRLRWERDALRIRLRKHRRLLDPRDHATTTTDLVHQFDYIVTSLLVTLVFPLYLVWLVYTYGEAAWMILGMVTLGYMVLDLVAFVAALIVVDRPGAGRSLPHALMFGLCNAYFIRAIRLAAFAQEWIFRRSYADEYVPVRVRRKAPCY